MPSFGSLVVHLSDQAQVQRVPQDFEWNGFVKRNVGLLIDPNGPKRAVENIKVSYVTSTQWSDD